MLHIGLHVLVPLLVALALDRASWRPAFVLMVATMIVDLDHLLADPIYVAERCSIGYHPLHSLPAIGLYALLFVLPLVYRRGAEPGLQPKARVIHWLGLGLLIHMLLDGIDCL